MCHHRATSRAKQLDCCLHEIIHKYLYPKPFLPGVNSLIQYIQQFRFIKVVSHFLQLLWANPDHQTRWLHRGVKDLYILLWTYQWTLYLYYNKNFYFVKYVRKRWLLGQPTAHCFSLWFHLLYQESVSLFTVSLIYANRQTILCATHFYTAPGLSAVMYRVSHII